MSWLWNFDWFASVLQYLGLTAKRGTLVFVGLDNAGKTTLLHRLKNDRLAQHTPTYHETSEELTLGGIRFTAYDLGGHKQARRVWREYGQAADGIVFLVDAADPARLEEAARELRGLLDDPQIAHCPLVVLGNKIDRPNALNGDQLVHLLGIGHLLTGKQPNVELAVRPLEVFSCSVFRRQGYGDAFRWLSAHLP